MVLKKRRSLGEFHAKLRKAAGGLFRTEYNGEINPENPDAREIPDYHVGTSPDDVRIWVEQMATGLGYSKVVWDELPPKETIR